MKLNTNSTLILFGIFAFAVMACFPITLFAMPLIQPTQVQPNDPAATVQAMVTQTMYAMTQTAPTQTAIPATADSASAYEYACSANQHASSHSDGCFVLRLGYIRKGCFHPGRDQIPVRGYLHKNMAFEEPRHLHVDSRLHAGLRKR